MFTKKFGKPIGAALYALAAYLAGKKKPAALITLVVTHLCEYLFIGRKVGKDNGIGQAETLTNCLAFGFAWWLPIKEDSALKTEE